MARDAVADDVVERIFADHVDRAAEQFFQLTHECNVVYERRVITQLDQQIHVASLVGLASEDRPE